MALAIDHGIGHQVMCQGAGVAVGDAHEEGRKNDWERKEHRNGALIKRSSENGGKHAE